MTMKCKMHLPMLPGGAFDLQKLVFTALAIVLQKGLAFHEEALQSFLIDRSSIFPSCLLSVKHFLIEFI